MKMVQDKGGGEYEMVWTFFAYAGETVSFQNLRIELDDISEENNQLTASPWDAYCSFETIVQSYPFPLIISELDSLDGTMHIDLPSDLDAGQYTVHITGELLYEGELPLFGRLLSGSGLFSSIANVFPSDYSTLPLIRAVVKQSIITGSGGPASAEEKAALVNLLKDWRDDTEAIIQPAFDDIALLDEVTSTSEEIYAAYEQAISARLHIPSVTIIIALYSVRDEALT